MNYLDYFFIPFVHQRSMSTLKLIEMCNWIWCGCVCVCVSCQVYGNAGSSQSAQSSQWKQRIPEWSQPWQLTHQQQFHDTQWHWRYGAAAAAAPSISALFYSIITKKTEHKDRTNRFKKHSKTFWKDKNICLIDNLEPDSFPCISPFCSCSPATISCLFK